MKSRKIGLINGTRKYGNNVRKNTVKRGGRFTGLFGSFSKDPKKNFEAIKQGEKRFGIKYGSYRSQIAKGLLQILDNEISVQRLIVEKPSNNIDPTTFTPLCIENAHGNVAFSLIQNAHKWAF